MTTPTAAQKEGHSFKMGLAFKRNKRANEFVLRKMSRTERETGLTVAQLVEHQAELKQRFYSRRAA